MEWVSIGYSYGLLLVRRQAIIWTNTDAYCQLVI